MIAQDDSNGGGSDGLLSFGIGRRASEGGAQYDGINTIPVIRGQAPGSDGLPQGTYYVAVAAASGGAVFGDGFFAGGAGSGGGSTLRIRTNVATGAIGASVPPVATRITGIGGEDPIVSPGGITPDTALFSPGLFWYDVQLCRDADASNAISIQLTSAATSEPPGKVMYLFNSSGNLVAEASGTRPSLPTLNFGGSDPVLPAGTYYIAAAFDYSGSDTDVAPNAATNGRWHVRPRVNDGGYTLGITITVPWADCPGPVCDPDFNCDGNSDQDDVACMIDVVAGNPGCQCADPDFNLDGNVDQDDVAALINVVAGGPCP